MEQRLEAVGRDLSESLSKNISRRNGSYYRALRWGVPGRAVPGRRS